MFKLSVLLFLFVLLNEGVHGCIPMRIIDPITIPVTTTTFIPPQSCPTPPGTAAIYIEDGVGFGELDGYAKTDPIGTCINSTKGDIAYYDGATNVNFDDNNGRYIGLWVRGNCATPCICSATACYIPVSPNPSIDPQINLLPHCQTPQNCFVAVVFGSPGSLVNVLNPTDEYSYADQTASGTDITDPSYPKVTQIGCSSCPLMID